MSAYVIFVVDEEMDAEGMADYRKNSRGSLQDRNVKVVTLPSCRKEVLEGEDAACVVILEFPSMEEARGWYHSDEYQKWVPVRQAASRGRAFLVEGFVPDPAHWVAG